MPFVPILIGAGIGLAKNQLIDAPEEERERELAAKTIQFSPWTKADVQKAQATIHPANGFKAALEGGGAGLSMGQQFGQGGNPYSSPGVGQGVQDNSVSGYDYKQNPYAFWGVQKPGGQ